MTYGERDMLWRCALAEFFTSPSVPSDWYDRAGAIRSLTSAGLIKWHNGQRLTDAGRVRLAGIMTDEQHAQLDKLKTNRENARKDHP